MLARLQQLISAAVLAVAVGAWIFFGTTSWLSAVLVSLALPFGYATVLASEFYLSARVNLRATPAIRAMLWWSAWAAEVVVGPAIFCWRQPFRMSAESDFFDAGLVEGRRGVVFVHGLFCNRAFWAPWMRRLRSNGHCFVSINLEPVFGTIDSYIDQITCAIAKVADATGMPVVIVCHSMGGLAARKWLATAVDQSVVHRVVTIATPHRGTWLARFANSQNGREMRLDAPWLDELDKLCSPEVNRKFICWYSPTDNIVFPSANACLGGAENRRVDGFGHVCLAFAPIVIEQTLALLTHPSTIKAEC